MVVADLHVHTTRSDGTLSFDEVPAAARRAGVEVVAVTDHDRLQPALDGPATQRDGVTLLHGIELRVETETQRLDLLGYGVDPTDELRTECARIQRNRRERGARIIECVEDRLGVSLPVEPRDGLGRPHIARGIAEVSDHTFQSAFDELIGDDCPCYVPREVPSFERGCAVLSDACGLVGLAHPFRYPDTAAALSKCASLDAVERWYPYGRAVDDSLVDDAIERYDLVPTGGSDAHGETLGDTGLDSPAWDRVETALNV
ncbi:unknown [Haloarcula marismortui ATCC 43049]|uniref:PHP domain-containing protein n=1 Tax=Haloarcula marismortui (strain ATCC 43049 / DSM 3752 / JCM 8966 / VKM B-1809) TaxID=272569 RepID=Q5UYJ4_HALMA|nr:PHP domain-containing protein [Haloarcula marismortui]AAV47659.1 unknown [Haloarcula marismortui ATCC 43049]QCP92349.1 PHP domain-containing protein [Haloarcula marismortui ATCC 43049]